MVITLLKLLGLPSFLTIAKVKGCANRYSTTRHLPSRIDLNVTGLKSKHELSYDRLTCFEERLSTPTPCLEMMRVLIISS